jgi:microcystin-dependent protein
MDRDLILRGDEPLAVPRRYTSGMPFRYVHDTATPGEGEFSSYSGTYRYLVFSLTADDGQDASVPMKYFWGGIVRFYDAETLRLRETTWAVDGTGTLVNSSTAKRYQQLGYSTEFASGDDGKLFFLEFSYASTPYPTAEAFTAEGNGSPGEVYFGQIGFGGFIIVRPVVGPTSGRVINLPEKDGQFVVIDAPSAGDTVQFDGTDWQKVKARPSLVGEVKMWAGSSLPAGYLWCDGSVISRTTYAGLFSVLGTTYGAGDGSTTFALPDLRGRVAAGKDDMDNSVGTGGGAANRITNAAVGITGTTLGSSGGSQTHLLLSTESGVPAHTHPYVDRYRDSNNNFANGSVSRNAGALTSGNYTTSPNIAADASAAHNNVQPTLILNHIICSE